MIEVAGVQPRDDDERVVESLLAGVLGAIPDARLNGASAPRIAANATFAFTPASIRRRFAPI